MDRADLTRFWALDREVPGPKRGDIAALSGANARTPKIRGIACLGVSACRNLRALLPRESNRAALREPNVLAASGDTVIAWAQRALIGRPIPVEAIPHRTVDKLTIRV